MVKRFNNQFLRDNTCLTTKSQMLFYQKMVELLHAHSGISYSFKIHNSYTILKELLDAIIDYEKNKINGMTVEELRKGKGQILRPTPNTAPLICGACYNTQPEDLLTMA